MSNIAFQLGSPTRLQSGIEFSPLVPPGAMFSIWLEGVWGTTWQLLVIAATAGVAVAFVVVSSGSVWYAVAACYALVGAGISSSLGGFTVLAAALGVGVAAVVGSTIVVRALLAPRPAPAPGNSSAP